MRVRSICPTPNPALSWKLRYQSTQEAALSVIPHRSKQVGKGRMADFAELCPARRHLQTAPESIAVSIPTMLASPFFA